MQSHVLCKRGAGAFLKQTPKGKDTEKRRGYETMETELGVMQPQTKECKKQ